MRVRVVRSVKVKPRKFRDFLKLSLDTAARVEAQTKICPDVFWVRHKAEDEADVKVFMDFDSLAQYEKLFLEGLLYDKNYLTLAEKAVDMILEEPRDELLVLMDQDDFFMNLKSSKRLAPANLARGAVAPRRNRMSRHVDVPTGKLRDFMKSAFEFSDRFQRVAGFRPEVFCTRFTQERIGCSKIFFDFDECPQCDSILLDQKLEWAQKTPELIDGTPVDELYVRATQRDLAANF
jgi:hypothetical protein